jgi:hypothetical protein
MVRVFYPAATTYLAMLEMLIGVSIASAGEPPRTMAELVRSPEHELEALYRASPPGPVPSGFLPGRAIKSPGSRFAMANARMTRLAWQGKFFRDDGTMINRVFGAAKALPASVYYGDSLVDGKSSLILDYSQSILWPNVRDEIREVTPGLYLGVMFDGKTVAKQKMYFTLDSRK